VALARAIVRRPQVLLLDEPLSALDAKLREAMQVELRHLHRELGITFLLVTHDQTEAMVMSDRVLIMDKGRVVQDGTPSDLYNRPASPYVSTFLGTSNLLPVDVIGIEGGTLVMKLGETVLRVPQTVRKVSAGETALLSVRPEKSALHVLGEREAVPAGVLVGRIIEHHFHGSTIRSSVDIGGNSPFIVDRQLASQVEINLLPKAGTVCAITLDGPSIIVFPGRAM